MILNFIINVETKNPLQQDYTSPIGIASNFLRIKADPDSSVMTLFQSPAALNAYRISMPGEPGRIATIEQFHHAMRRYVVVAIDWVNSIFDLAQVNNVTLSSEIMGEKVLMLKNAFSSFCVLQKATQSAKMMMAHGEGSCECLVLSNGSLIPRELPRHLHELQFFSNNIIPKLIDELVIPCAKLGVTDAEKAVLTALIFLESESRGMSAETAHQLSSFKNLLQLSLFQHCCDNIPNVTHAANRFATLLLLLPTVARFSAVYNENVQMAKMFGVQPVDKYVLEIMLNDTDPTPPTSENHRFDVTTQTQNYSESEELGRIGNELVALGLDLSDNPPIIPSTHTSTHSSPHHHQQGSIMCDTMNAASNEMISPPCYSQSSQHSASSITSAGTPSIAAAASRLSSDTPPSNNVSHKPPPLIVSHAASNGHLTNANFHSPTHHHPIVSAPVYPFYFNYNQQHNITSNGFSFDNIHTNGIQSAGPFNNSTFFDHHHSQQQQQQQQQGNGGGHQNNNNYQNDFKF